MQTLHHWHQPTDKTLQSQRASKLSQHKFLDSQGPERILTYSEAYFFKNRRFKKKKKQNNNQEEFKIFLKGEMARYS